jgi:predicted transcriptional regulator
MRSIKNLANYSTGKTLSSDDLIEFHASRLLLLIAVCGSKDLKAKTLKIEGLTKLAKLDFFVRYPAFFNRVAAYLDSQTFIANNTIESKMIRFHYGPWDKRYYQVIPYLEARGLIKVAKNGSTYNFSLTELGKTVSEKLTTNEQFTEVTERMKNVKKVLGGKTGSALKELIYKVFDEEVKEKDLNDII